EFMTRANNHAMILQNGLNEYLNKLVALRALFEATNYEIGRGEFERFSSNLLEGQRAIQNVSWIPRILDSERAAREFAADQQGIPGYHIKSIAGGGKLARSAPKDEYFPIYYSTEMPRTSRIYGIDLASEPMRRQTLERARDSGEPAMSKDFLL